MKPLLVSMWKLYENTCYLESILNQAIYTNIDTTWVNISVQYLKSKYLHWAEYCE